MVRRLLASGCDITVWNRTSSKAMPLAALGATVADQVGEAVSTAQIAISMLEAGPAVAEVMRAALAHLQLGALWIDMSSTQPAEATNFHALLAEHGHHFLDAPVSGGVAGAEAGSLAIMVGGSAGDFERVSPLLTAMGRPTLVGPPGSGQVAKLCNQLIVGATLNIVAEALLLAQAAGADPAAMRDAIRGGFAESRILEVHGRRMLDRNFVPGGQVKSQLKDLRNVLAAAATAGLSLPIAALVTEHYQTLLVDHADADHAAILLALEHGNPGLRLGAAPDRLPE